MPQGIDLNRCEGGQVNAITWHLRLRFFSMQPDTEYPNLQMATHGYPLAIDFVTLVHTDLLWAVYIPNVQDLLKYICFAVVRSCAYEVIIFYCTSIKPHLNKSLRELNTFHLQTQANWPTTQWLKRKFPYEIWFSTPMTSAVFRTEIRGSAQKKMCRFTSKKQDKPEISMTKFHPSDPVAGWSSCIDKLQQVWIDTLSIEDVLNIHLCELLMRHWSKNTDRENPKWVFDTFSSYNHGSVRNGSL